jgi:hypothetical protein
LGESRHDLFGGTEKDSLAFSYREVKASNHAEGDLFVLEAEFSAGGRGEGRLFGLEEAGVDSGVDDMELFGIDSTSVAMMPFGDRGGRIVVTLT